MMKVVLLHIVHDELIESHLFFHTENFMLKKEYTKRFHEFIFWSHSRGAQSWWRHQMETFSALLAICAGNSPETGEFSAKRPVTQSFDVFFDLRLKREAGDLRRHRSHYDFTVMVALTMIEYCPITQTPTGQAKVWWWHAWKMVVIYLKRIYIHCYLVSFVIYELRSSYIASMKPVFAQSVRNEYEYPTIVWSYV